MSGYVGAEKTLLDWKTWAREWQARHVGFPSSSRHDRAACLEDPLLCDLYPQFLKAQQSASK